MERGSMLYMIAPPMPFYVIGGVNKYNPGDEHPDRYAIGVFDMLLVMKGELRITEERRSWRVGPGQMLILRPDLHHYSAGPCEEETHHYWLHFMPAGEWWEIPDDQRPPEKDMLVQLQSARTKFPLHRVYSIAVPKYGMIPSPGKTFDALNHLIQSELEPPSLVLWKHQSILDELIRDLHRDQKSVNDTQAVRLAEQAEAFLKQNYKQPITNAMLGEALNFHPNYIARSMRNVLGFTPVEYLMQYRLEQAKLLLMKTELSIMKIAEEVGFQQTAYFSRCFSTKEGISPLQFRKKFKKNG
ncbi:helix-turn-helix transcriptional regulator [Cohnella herbarum]|uniref:AraC family transcriptional regulator n=1 Tax=Cohnella herbarum TaxID=2728023 RepID=A0A7Z2VGN5_9BACL|nr:AraC family transcriptional regulator [Cohnella herbarum]QJD82734.1 AraC family transcriptional regulator [Cohnella herbarum]